MQGKSNAQFTLRLLFFHTKYPTKYHFTTEHTESVAAEKKETKVNKYVEVYDLGLDPCLI